MNSQLVKLPIMFYGLFGYHFHNFRPKFKWNERTNLQEYQNLYVSDVLIVMSEDLILSNAF